MKDQLGIRECQGNPVACKPGAPDLNGGSIGVCIHADGAQDGRMFNDTQLKRLRRGRKLGVDPCRDARVIRHTRLCQTRCHGWVIAQMAWQIRQSVGRKDTAEQCNGLVFHQRQALVDMDQRAGFKPQGFGLGRMCDAGL